MWTERMNVRPLAVLVAAGAGLAGSAAVVHAAGLLEVDQVIFGMDCAPCAYGIEQGLRKLRGVRQVTVSLNRGKALVVFAPDSPTSLEQIRETIRKNGFTPKDARLRVAGRLAREGDALLLDAGAVRYRLAPADGAPWEALRKLPSGSAVELTARVPERPDDPLRLLVTGYTPVSGGRG